MYMFLMIFILIFIGMCFLILDKIYNSLKQIKKEVNEIKFTIQNIKQPKKILPKLNESQVEEDRLLYINKIKLEPNNNVIQLDVNNNIPNNSN